MKQDVAHTDDRCEDEHTDEIADNRKQVPANITETHWLVTTSRCKYLIG